MSMSGMNVAVVRDVGRQLKAQARTIEDCARSIDRVVDQASSFWRGPDVEQFSRRWAGEYRRAALLAAAHLTELADTADRNAQAQERTSATLDGGAGPGSGGGGGVHGVQGGVGSAADDNKAAGPLTPLTNQPGTSDADLKRENIRQGSIGDCWLVSAIGGVGGTDPQFIRDHVQRNPDGSYTVTMYDKQGGFWPWDPTTFKEAKVTVPAEYFKNGVKDSGGNPSVASIYEAAAAMHRGGSAHDINGGYVSEGLELVTGRPATTHNDPPLSEIQKGLSEGRIYEAASNNDSKWWPFDGAPDKQVVSNHAYMVDKVEMHDGELKVHVLNPWGSASAANAKAEDLWMTEKEFHDNFADVASVAGK